MWAGGFWGEGFWAAGFWQDDTSTPVAGPSMWRTLIVGPDNRGYLATAEAGATTVYPDRTT